MARTPSVAPHLSVDQVIHGIKGTVAFRTVRNLVSQYNRLGSEVIEGPGKEMAASHA